MRPEPNPYATQAGDAITRCRIATGLTQEDFAFELQKRTGRRINPSTVHRWETGRHVPPADALLAARDIAGLTYDVAFTGAPVEVISVRERLAVRLIREVQEDILESIRNNPGVSAKEREIAIRQLRRWSPVRAEDKGI